MTEHTKSKFNSLLTNNVQKQAASSSSIENSPQYIFSWSVNYLYRNEQVFEILFVTHISPSLFFPFFLLLLNNVDCKILKNQGPALTWWISLSPRK